MSFDTLSGEALEAITQRVNAIPVRPAGDWKFGSAFANAYVGEAGQFRLLTTRRLEVHTTEFEHEVAIMHIDRTRDNFKLTCMNAPVLIVYGRLPIYFRYMVGYIAHVEPARVGPTPSEKYVVFAVGPTWRLGQPYAQTWEGHTSHHIIRDICQRNYLAADVELAEVIWSSAIMSLEETQWQFLVRLCKASGLGMAPRGTTIHVRRRDDIIRREADRAEFFFDGEVKALRVQVDRSNVPARHWVRPDVNDDGEPEDTTPPMPAPEDDLLMQICRPEVYIRPESDALSPPVGAVDNALAGHYVRPGVESPHTQLAPEDDMLIPADPTAAWIARRRSETFPVIATCHVPGSARVHAGGVVRLLPRGNTPWSGLWYVLSAWHVFEGSDTGVAGDPHYFMRLRVGDRDLPNDPRPGIDADESGESGGQPRPSPHPNVPEGEGPRGGGGRPLRPQPSLAPPILVVTRPPVYPPTPTPYDPQPGDPPNPGAVTPDPPPVGLSAVLPGPTCPLQPGPFLASEWRSSFPASVEFDDEVPEGSCASA